MRVTSGDRTTSEGDGEERLLLLIMFGFFFYRSHTQHHCANESIDSDSNYETHKVEFFFFCFFGMYKHSVLARTVVAFFFLVTS